MLTPGGAPPGANEMPEKLVPFKLKLAPVEIEPLLPALSDAFAGTGTLSSALRVNVKKFNIKGNTVFSDRELQKVIARFSGREISSAELEEARQALTVYYVDHGYINSGAVLPDQDLKDGIVVINIVEGRVTEVDVSGNWWTRSWWLRHVLNRAAGRPLNFNQLKEGLQLLRQNPNIKQVNGELMPGGAPGESILKASVREIQPFRASLDFSNRRPPSVGAEILELNVADLNLSGHFDRLSMRYGIAHTTAETIDQWIGSELENIEGAYEFPIAPWGTTMEVHAGKNDSAIVEEQFQLLNITSKSEQYGLTLRQPLIESLNNDLAVALTADKRKSDTFVLGRPFSLSPGAVDGDTQVFVMRLAIEFVNRSQVHVLAIRSTFNLGINEWEATRSVPGKSTGTPVQRLPDGQFFSWLGQAQYVRRLFDTDSLAVVRLNAQLASDPILSLEQFSLGGVQSVRGYRENQLLRDNGVFGSIEVRVPVWRNKEKAALLTFAPFADFGVGWDRVEFIGGKPKGGIDNRMETLGSLGAGLIFTPSRYVSAQLYWGYALNHKNTVRDGENLQDYGLHFAVSIAAF